MARHVVDVAEDGLHDSEVVRENWLFGFQRGAMVASRSQFGLPA
jgi:hypothetical protein